MKYSIFLSLFLVILITACEDSSSVIDESKEPISLPFEVGKTWDYLVINHNYVSNSIDTVETKLSFTVSSDTVLDGKTWYFLKSDKNPYQILMGGYYSNQEDGIHYKRTLDQVSDKRVSTEISAVESGEPVLVTTDYLAESSNFIDTYIPPAFPNPGDNPQQFLVQTEQIIGVIAYEGTTITDSGSTLFDYSKYYYQQTIGSITYTFVPFKYNYQINNVDGIVTFELGYFSRENSQEGDNRLHPYIISTFKLIKG